MEKSRYTITKPGHRTNALPDTGHLFSRAMRRCKLLSISESARAYGFNFRFNCASGSRRWSVLDCIPTPERGNDNALDKSRYTITEPGHCTNALPDTGHLFSRAMRRCKLLSISESARAYGFNFRFNCASGSRRWSVLDCIPTPERGNDNALDKSRYTITKPGHRTNALPDTGHLFSHAMRRYKSLSIAESAKVLLSFPRAAWECSPGRSSVPPH